MKTQSNRELRFSDSGSSAASCCAPFWIASIKPYLPAALKDPFEDPRIVQVANRVNAIELALSTNAFVKRMLYVLGESSTGRRHARGPFCATPERLGR